MILDNKDDGNKCDSLSGGIVINTAGIKTKKFSLDDIKVGMRVFKEQLSNIYDTWIIIYKPKDVQMQEDGIIGFIGKETNEESAALYTNDNIITPVYNDSIDLEGNIYEE